MKTISLVTMEDKKMLRFMLKGSLLMVACSYGISANAASFLLESEINARVTYDDNVNTAIVNEESSSIYMFTPKMKLSYISDAWETAMNAHVTGTTYSAEYQDQIDGHLDFQTAYKDNRNIYSTSVGYDKSSNRAADENILGQTLEQTDTQKISLTPKYTRLLTERLSLSLAYTYSDVDYNPTTQRYLPYESQDATGEMAYNLSQRSKMLLAFSARDYASENNISEYQMLAANIGVIHKFSDLLTGEFFVGANTTDFTTRDGTSFDFFGSTVTGAQVESTGSGGTFKAGIDAKWIELSASRDTASNFTGGLDQTDKLHAKFRIQVTQLIGFALSVNRVKIEELNENVIDYSRTYTAITPAMNLSLAHNLNLRAEYFYYTNEYESLAQGETEKNRFSVNLKYDFPSIY